MKDVICLYDETGIMGAPWAEAGFSVFCYDILHKEQTTSKVGSGTITFVPWDARDTKQNEALIARHSGSAKILFGFPPCTDLAVSGAKHFAVKEKKDPLYRQKAMALVYLVRDIGQELRCPFMIENPISVISSAWRKPDYIFQPYWYGGYLPEDDKHPMFPAFIKPRDAYPKTTCLWVGNGFKPPKKRPVPCAPGWSLQTTMLGGKSLFTKRVRSATPRGFARAVFLANA